MAEHSPVVLLCGYGAFGERHAEGWLRAVPDVRLIVADPDGEARRRAAARLPAADVRADFRTAMDDADIIDIVTPPAHHHAAAMAAIAAGRPFLLEKPAVSSRTEAATLTGALDATGLTAQIQFVLRAHPLTRRATAMLEDGAIGRIRRMEGAFLGWKRMRADSSLLENDGVHFLDLMRYFIGAAPVGVDARGLDHLGGGIADTLRIDLTFAEGVSATLDLGVLKGGEHDDRFVPGAVTTKTLSLIGDGGTLDLDFNSGVLSRRCVHFKAVPGGWHPHPGRHLREQGAEPDPAGLLAASFSVFMDALAGRGEVLCDAHWGAAGVTATLDAVQQALTRRPAPMITIGRV